MSGDAAPPSVDGRRPPSSDRVECEPLPPLLRDRFRPPPSPRA